ncbi:beta-ribofuranosylaminobenzene 5'-phosphate synthase family protein [Herbaspirillum sp. NPDC087042]|uniref:beta-ribofuranosylaminobenzene 5'-phosphate synthase family protein n=1 Tax=Herbaspirillum sp. NPDC087042 TaxID=3364004 RepID=UPI0037F8D50F
MLKISVPSRVHITLLELGDSGYRRNGGLGFSIDRPSVELTFEKANHFSIEALEAIGFDVDELASLHKRLEATKDSFLLENGLRLSSVYSAGRHVGFGSGTAVALSLIEALALLNGRIFDQTQISQMSGRGGTSGIGINTYFTGGFVFDAGRILDNSPFKSSDDIPEPPTTPLVVTRHNMPDWPIGIFTPNDVPAVSIQMERHLFSSSLPLAMRDVETAVYHGIMGALVAVIAGDYSNFCRAINKIQHCDWKRKEIALSSPALSSYLTALHESGCDGVGVSSLGPSIYFLSKNIESTLNRIKSRFPNALVEIAHANNTGRKVEYV